MAVKAVSQGRRSHAQTGCCSDVRFPLREDCGYVRSLPAVICYENVDGTTFMLLPILNGESFSDTSRVGDLPGYFRGIAA